MESKVKELIDFWEQIGSDFDDSLKERTPEVIAYDNAVLKELRKGRSIKKALKMAEKKYPNEALQYNDNTIKEIDEHYDYLRNHELIIKKTIFFVRRVNQDKT